MAARPTRTPAYPPNAKPTKPAGLSLAVPESLVEAVADRVAALLADRIEPAADPWLTVEDAAAHIGCPKSRIYALVSCKPPRIPFERDGSRLVFKRSEPDAWIRNGGAKRAMRRCPPVAHGSAMPHQERLPHPTLEHRMRRSAYR